MVWWNPFSWIAGLFKGMFNLFRKKDRESLEDYELSFEKKGIKYTKKQKKLTEDEIHKIHLIIGLLDKVSTMLNHLPRDPKFEDIPFKAGINRLNPFQAINAMIKALESILNPKKRLSVEDERKKFAAYRHFWYGLNSLLEKIDSYVQRNKLEDNKKEISEIKDISKKITGYFEDIDKDLIEEEKNLLAQEELLKKQYQTVQKELGK